MNPKLTSLDRLTRELARLKARGKRIVFTNGCFDILHIGHVRYLKKARSIGDLLVVGLNSDSSVRGIKPAGRPVNRQADRAEILSSLYFVDRIVIFDDLTPERLIKKINPDILVKGGDWKVRDIVGYDHVRSYGGRVVSIPFVKGYSTTGLIRKISK